MWNFSFGANINPLKLENKRGIKPIDKLPCKLEDYRLIFNHRGGFGNIEMTNEQDPIESISPTYK